VVARGGRVRSVGARELAGVGEDGGDRACWSIGEGSNAMAAVVAVELAGVLEKVAMAAAVRFVT
jgi:hypothetical protein